MSNTRLLPTVQALGAAAFGYRHPLITCTAAETQTVMRYLASRRIFLNWCKRILGALVCPRIERAGDRCESHI